MKSKITFQQYIAFLSSIERSDKLIWSGDFGCPDSGQGVCAVWDTEKKRLWFEICTNGIWQDQVPSEETYQWCIDRGVMLCLCEEGALAILENISGDRYIGF